MSDIYIDVDTAVTMPVNILSLIDDTDFKTRETGIAYNQAGMDLVWNFVSTAGVQTQTAVTPTTGGDYDWTHVGDGMYKIEIPASGGASANNDAEGSGWFSGICTGVLAWRGPIMTFRAAALNDALIDGGDVLDVSLTEIGGVAQSATDLKDFADAGYDPATNKVQGVVLTDTATTVTNTVTADVASISGDSTAADNLELDYDGTGYNKAASEIATVNNVANVVDANIAQIKTSIPAATNLGADYDGTGYNKSNSTIATATGVTNDVGITQAGADKVWSSAARTLTSFGTLIADTWNALTSGMTTVGSIGKKLADWIVLTAAQVNAEADTALADYSPSTHSAAAVRTEMDSNSTELAKMGTIPALDGASQTIGGAIGKIADDNGGADYDATDHSLKAIRDNLSGGAADWSSAEREQIRDAMGVDGTKTAAAGGQLQGVKAKSDNLPASPANETTVAANGTKIDTAQADLDILTGTNGVELATSQPNYAPSTHAAADIWSVSTRTLTSFGTLVSDIWDELASGHDINGSFGRQIRKIFEAFIIDDGTFSAATTSTATLNGAASSIDNFYKHVFLGVIEGTGVGQIRIVESYVGSTKIATILPDWTTTPDDTSGYIILGIYGNVHAHEVETLGTQAKADVNVEVADVLKTDTIAELAGVPGATPTSEEALMWLYMRERNKRVLDANNNEEEIYNDANTKISEATASDAGGITTREKYRTPT